MSFSCVIGVDLGTSGCRAIAIDLQARIIASAVQALPAPLSPETDHYEQDPQLWWQALIEVLRTLSAQLTDYRVTRLAIDATSASVLLTDAQAQPLGPALMYRDQRAKSEAAYIARYAPSASPARGASASLAKLLSVCAGNPGRKAKEG
ncbi:FGGY family carbohydrate kinase [Thiorhodospira sibirica]|uniref:FGGY family carbohydrate kinase n=1 Tax=Thiorhodospira sibirica TaxID=154347 RepID=UPI00022C0443|nr:FGGY family carbohydrate kinase [Thiorhodospira sibirica]